MYQSQPTLRSDALTTIFFYDCGTFDRVVRFTQETAYGLDRTGQARDTGDRVSRHSKTVPHRVSTIIYHIFLLFPSLHSQFLVIYGISDKAGAYGPVGLGEHYSIHVVC